MKDVVQYNKIAWDKKVAEKNRWTQPVSHEEIEDARKGNITIYLTPSKPVPSGWFPPFSGTDTLCLASGGGQQAPILAAAGMNVTSFDNSPCQLQQDLLVAEREDLQITTIEGDMADLSVFPDESFDFIFNPASTCFIPSVRPVWNECFRVLRKGGTLITGLINPVEFSFDIALYDQGVFTLKYALPYSDLTSITDEERIRFFGPDEAVAFGHTLEDLIGGQLAAGFHLISLFEDYRDDGAIKEYMPSFIATRALKPFASNN